VGKKKASGSDCLNNLGNGGETHQVTPNGQLLTTNHGTPVADNQNSLRSGEKGPTLLEDFILREKIFHFDHERIPERIVHARGSAAHGYFECTKPIPDLTSACLFQEAGKRTPVFVRFSTVAGGAGSTDTPRDVRGFATKFYTEQGNWDLVGNNIPVFFIQDAMKFPDLVHAVKMEADRGFPQAATAHDTFWDFIGLMPESMHMVMWAMSDRTLPRSLRMMEGFGVHTFQFINDEGKVTFVKFHWKPMLGMQSTLWDEAVKIAGADPDYHRRDLWDFIETGLFPSWELGVQTFDEAWASKQPYDVLDATKLIPEEDLPVQVIGRMVLDRNPSNHFAENEQVAFLPSNVIPGIGFSNDPLLQGRLFSYLDTQKSRLGTTNFHQIPINAPKCPFANFQRDGLMQTQVPTGRANYEPNSLASAGESGGPRASKVGYTTAATPGGDKLRIRPESFADHYSQARMFLASQSDVERSHMSSAFIFELSKVTLDHVRDRILSNLRNVDESFASRVASGIGCRLPPASSVAKLPYDCAPSLKLSIVKNAKRTLEGRRVAVLISEGATRQQVDSLLSALRDAKAVPVVVASKLKRIALDDGFFDADAQLAGSPSVLFDAVAVIANAEAAKKMSRDPKVLAFVRDAYMHLKALGVSAQATSILDAAGIEKGAGITGLADDFLSAACTRFYDRESLFDL
jgi:catalase